MTPNEYRKKHKRCATCTYFDAVNYKNRGFCEVKRISKWSDNGKFCRVYKAKEFYK